MVKPIRWGILGTGWIANEFAQGLSQLSDAELVAVGSRTLESAERFGTLYEVPHRHGSYQALADDVASGEWVDLPGIGKIQVIREEANGTLTSFGKDGGRVRRRVTHRLRTKVRLYEKFKERCRK